MNESISSLFESLDEWLNDQNTIVRTVVYILYTVNSKSITFCYDRVATCSLPSPS